MIKKEKFKRFALFTKDKISKLSQNKVENKQLLKDWRRFARKFSDWWQIELLIESAETNSNPWKQLKTIYSKQFWNELFPIAKKINDKQYVIYCLKWTKTGHYYIGRADNLKERLNGHRQAAKSGYYLKTYARATIQKELFWDKIEILEYPRTKQDLLRAEQYYLDNHYSKKLCLNCSTDAYGGVSRWRKHYQSWKNKLLEFELSVKDIYRHDTEEKPKCDKPQWRWEQLAKFKAERPPVGEIKVMNDLMLENALKIHIKNHPNWLVRWRDYLTIINDPKSPTGCQIVTRNIDNEKGLQ